MTFINTKTRYISLKNLESISKSNKQQLASFLQNSAEISAKDCQVFSELRDFQSNVMLGL